MKGKVKGNEKERRYPGCCASRHHLTLFTYYYERKLGDSCASYQLKDKNVLRIKRGKKSSLVAIGIWCFKSSSSYQKRMQHILFVYYDLCCISLLPMILCARGLDIPRMKRHFESGLRKYSKSIVFKQGFIHTSKYSSM